MIWISPISTEILFKSSNLGGSPREVIENLHFWDYDLIQNFKIKSLVTQEISDYNGDLIWGRGRAELGVGVGKS